ncbi:hypothetical protein [Delftia sp. 60]|uniref:hypothetical protein n=1 Tax=Delftia sp. 60 TaxID=2035216 RepID=UPI001178BD50|nr:hypothetical protein [Delftia sp. 60]
MNPEWLAFAQKRAAYHEAGHAVMAMALRCYVGSVSIKQDIDGGNTGVIPPQGSSKISQIQRVLLAAAGVGAEKAFFRGKDDSFDNVIVGFAGDQGKAEVELVELGQSGAFVLYTEYASQILGSSNYCQLVTKLAEDVLREFEITEPQKLLALSKRVPPLDDLTVEACHIAVDMARRSR